MNNFFKEISEIIAASFNLEQLPILIVHLIALGSLFLCFLFLLYKPTKNFFLLRENGLKKINDDAELFLEEAQKKSQKATTQLNLAKETSVKLINDSKNEGNIQKKQILSLAYAEEGRIIKEANEKAKKLKKDVKKDIQESILKNALSLTEKIIKKEVDSEIHKKLIDDFIKNLDE